VFEQHTEIWVVIAIPPGKKEAQPGKILCLRCYR